MFQHRAEVTKPMIRYPSSLGVLAGMCLGWYLGKQSLAAKWRWALGVEALEDQGARDQVLGEGPAPCLNVQFITISGSLFLLNIYKSIHPFPSLIKKTATQRVKNKKKTGTKKTCKVSLSGRILHSFLCPFIFALINCFFILCALEPPCNFFSLVLLAQILRPVEQEPGLFSFLFFLAAPAACRIFRIGQGLNLSHSSDNTRPLGNSKSLDLG